MRMILIDSNSGYIFGDTADFADGNQEWNDATTGNANDGEALALLAARLLDESIGEYGREYSIGYRRDGHDGYAVYRADIDGREAIPVVTDGQSADQISAVEANCREVCFVEAHRK